MDYVKLNKSRHKVKTFDGKKIPTVDVKQIISAASLAPSAHNIQSWHFVIVESKEKREALLTEVDPGNHEQIKEAGAVIVLFSDTDLVERSREIARVGAGELDDEQLLRFNSRYPQMYEGFEELQEQHQQSPRTPTIFTRPTSNFHNTISSTLSQDNYNFNKIVLKPPSNNNITWSSLEHQGETTRPKQSTTTMVNNN